MGNCGSHTGGGELIIGSHACDRSTPALSFAMKHAAEMAAHAAIGAVRQISIMLPIVAVVVIGLIAVMRIPGPIGPVSLVIIVLPGISQIIDSLAPVVIEYLAICTGCLVAVSLARN